MNYPPTSCLGWRSHGLGHMTNKMVAHHMVVGGFLRCYLLAPKTVNALDPSKQTEFNMTRQLVQKLSHQVIRHRLKLPTILKETSCNSIHFCMDNNSYICI